MEIQQILRSTAVRFVKIEFPPSLFITDVVEALRARYRFFEVPDRVADVDPIKGMKFQLGRFENENIQKVELYDAGLVVEGQVETEILEHLLDDILGWGGQEFGLTYTDSRPVNRSYASNFEVKLTSDISKFLGAWGAVGGALTEMVQAQGFTVDPYMLSGMSLHSEMENAEPKPLRPAKFIFERRADRRWDDNIFFTEAPVGTEDHRRLLDILEQSL